MDTYIMLKRSDDTLALLSNPNAFALLTIIAIRARRTDAFNIHSLKLGEALIGDYKSCGLTRQQYRTALSKLEEWNFIATKATNKGTIATLADARVYDINKTLNNQQDNHQATIKQPTPNQQATTNNNDNNETNENKGNNGNNETSGSSFSHKSRISVASEELKFYDLTSKLFGVAKKADRTTLQNVAKHLSKSLDEKVFDKAWRVAQECKKTGDKPIALFMSRMKDEFDYRKPA